VKSSHKIRMLLFATATDLNLCFQTHYMYFHTLLQLCMAVNAIFNVPHNINYVLENKCHLQKYASWTASLTTTTKSLHSQSLWLALHSRLCLQHLCHNFLFLNQEGPYYPTIYSTHYTYTILYGMLKNFMDASMPLINITMTACIFNNRHRGANYD